MTNDTSDVYLGNAAILHFVVFHRHYQSLCAACTHILSLAMSSPRREVHPMAVEEGESGVEMAPRTNTVAKLKRLASNPVCTTNENSFSYSSSSIGETSIKPVILSLLAPQHLSTSHIQLSFEQILISPYRTIKRKLKKNPSRMKMRASTCHQQEQLRAGLETYLKNQAQAMLISADSLRRSTPKALPQENCSDI